jgi:undecaprenyl-diphosphatase
MSNQVWRGGVRRWLRGDRGQKNLDRSGFRWYVASVNLVKRAAVSLSVLLAVLWYTAPAVRSESIDERLYRTIHEDWQSPFMDDFMKGVSTLGSAEVGLAVTAALQAFGNESVRNTGKLSFVSLVGASAVTSVMKCAVNRDRPDSEPHSRCDSSFPSGHATGSFAIASVVGAKHSSLRIPVYLLASTIAVSRVYLGRHYPSDVLAGAAIGLCSGWLVIKYEQVVLDFHI